jgi:hypothetical protein
MKEIRSMSAFGRAIDSWPWPSEKSKEEFMDTMLPSIKTVAEVMKHRTEWGFEMPNWELELRPPYKVLVHQDFILD